MGRGKTVSDKAVLDGLLATIGNPGDLTFASAGKAVGLSAATLVQRFGTRDAMVEAVLLHAWDRLDDATAAADAKVTADPGGAIALLVQLTPAERDVTEGLLLLREDFRNPVLRARGAAWGGQLARALGRRLAEDPQEAERLGWQMASIWQGSLIWWGFHRETDARTAIETALTEWCANLAKC